MEHRASNSPSDYAQDVARRAAQLARSEQVDWKNLGQDERREFKRRIRENDKASSERE